jgi:hypothetical protein
MPRFEHDPSELDALLGPAFAEHPCNPFGSVSVTRAPTAPGKPRKWAASGRVGSVGVTVYVEGSKREALADLRRTVERMAGEGKR